VTWDATRLQVMSVLEECAAPGARELPGLTLTSVEETARRLIFDLTRQIVTPSPVDGPPSSTTEGSL